MPSGRNQMIASAKIVTAVLWSAILIVAATALVFALSEHPAIHAWIYACSGILPVAFVIIVVTSYFPVNSPSQLWGVKMAGATFLVFLAITLFLFGSVALPYKYENRNIGTAVAMLLWSVCAALTFLTAIAQLSMWIAAVRQRRAQTIVEAGIGAPVVQK